MTKSILAIKSIIILLLGCTILTSCKDDITFAAENKTTMDTMFLSRKHIMEDEIDSLCLTTNEQFYQEALDSIMAARITEIEARLNHLKNKSRMR